MTPKATYHDLRDAAVFVTGGGSGIGAAITDAFLAQGANVAFAQRSDATRFCDEMAARHNRRPLAVQADSTRKDDADAAIAAAVAAFGPLHVLVNNAANDDRHTADKIDEAYWDASQAINLKACFFVAQTAARSMRTRGGGAIVNITSISYMMGNPGYVSYTTANSALNGMTRSLAREWGADGIRVNAVAPGWVLTDRQMKLWYKEEGFNRYLKRQCLSRKLEEADIADGVLFLASNASEMITGQALVIDAGVVTTG